MENDTSKKLSYLSGSSSDIIMPSVENGMLVFNNQNEYDKYINGLDSFTHNLTSEQESFYDTNERDVDEILLDSIENSMGFISLRKTNLEKFENENENGWERVEDIPNYTWSSSSTEQSTLNEFKEVKIGNLIKKKISNDYTIYIDTKEEQVASYILSNARALQELHPDGGATLDEVRSLDYSMKYLTVEDLNTGEIVLKGTGEEIPLTEFAISGVIQNGSPCAGAFKQIRLKSFTLVQVTSWYLGYPGGTPVSAWYEIDYGNGVTQNAYGNSGPFGISFDQMYIYPSAGTYTITISARLSQNGPIVKTQTFQVIINNSSFACNASKKSETHIWNITPTQSLICDISFWTHFHFPSFGRTRNAKIHAQNIKKIGNRWKVRKAEKIFIASSSLAYKGECEPYETTGNNLWLETARFKNTARSFSVGSGPRHAPGLKYNTINSDFEVTIDDVIYYKSYVMSACN